MAGRSKRTAAPAPVEIPPVGAPAVAPPGAQPLPPPAIPSMLGPSAWCPSQSAAPSSAPYWFAGPQHPAMVGSSTQGPWWTPVGHGPSANLAPTTDTLGDSDPQAWGLDAHPPGGFLNILKSTPHPAQAGSNGTSSQPINIGDDTNATDCARTEKRLLWTKEEDLRLVSAWLNNSNDPIHANYKKNDQYWKGVAAVYNSTTPKNRRRLPKQIKDRFGRIKKRVAWFCGAWKEANALWASGESDVNLMDRALQIYEDEQKKDGPFMFKHCWDVLRKEPKWDAYWERLNEPEADKRKYKRKYSSDEDVGQQFSLDDAADERPIGAAIRDRPQHTQLKNDLIEHIWCKFGNRQRN